MTHQKFLSLFFSWTLVIASTLAQAHIHSPLHGTPTHACAHGDHEHEQIHEKGDHTQCSICLLKQFVQHAKLLDGATYHISELTLSHTFLPYLQPHATTAHRTFQARAPPKLL